MRNLTLFIVISLNVYIFNYYLVEAVVAAVVERFIDMLYFFWNGIDCFRTFSEFGKAPALTWALKNKKIGNK